MWLINLIIYYSISFNNLYISASSLYVNKFNKKLSDNNNNNKNNHEKTYDEVLANMLGIILKTDECGLYMDEDYSDYSDIKSINFNKELLNTKKPIQDLTWKSPLGLGQVAGVSIDENGRPVIFHRGNRIWDYDTFNDNFEYTKSIEGPISANTILTLNSDNGQIEDEWGKYMFYMPHGIHIDFNGNIWLTDVALHQVFKFPKREKINVDDPKPILALGERFIPGNDEKHFCQPTSVAVMKNGDIVVADGYCNSRILIFDPKGNLIISLPPNNNHGLFNFDVPHSLTILKRGDICTADRENQRIICFNVTKTEELQPNSRNIKTLAWSPSIIKPPGICRIFGIDSYDNIIYAVNGPPARKESVRGLTLNPNDGTIINTWSPQFNLFSNPHDIAIHPNGTVLYVTEIGPNVVWKFRILPLWETLGVM